jgi:hypothetical protein
MKTVFQVQSKLSEASEWLDDHLPFESENEAIEYIKTQPRCFEYRIESWDEPETAEEEWLMLNIGD